MPAAESMKGKVDMLRISKWLAFAFLGTGILACEPPITIADETSSAGEAGRAHAGSDSGGTSSSGGATSGGASGAAASGTGGAGAIGGGGTAAGGASGAIAGTGGVPGRARLGLRLMMQNPDDDAAGRLCPTATGVEWDIGAPIVANGMVVDVASPTPTDPGATLADGEEDAEIECVVGPDGQFNAEGNGIDPLMPPPNGRLNFTVSGTASLAGGVSVTGFTVYTPITQFLESTEGCTMSDVHEIAPGRFWGDIECPTLVKTGDPVVACKATGTVVMENCQIE